MAESEFDLIVKAARKLRERDRYHSKKLPQVKLTYWDADDWRVYAISNNLLPAKIKTKYGYTLEIHPQVTKKEVICTQNEVIIRVDGSHIVEFQFAPEEHLKAIATVLEVFPGADVFELNFDGQEEMIDYCRKMDAIIVETAKEMNKAKVAQVFKKLWSEFGGADDRLTRRVAWYRDLAQLYQGDRAKWKADMTKTGLLS